MIVPSNPYDVISYYAANMNITLSINIVTQ